MKKAGLIMVGIIMVLLPIFYIQAEENVWQITEVMANAADENSGEFVELKYTGEVEQFLSGWTVSDGKETDNLIDFVGEFDAGKSGLVVARENVLLIVDSGYAGEYNGVFDENEIDLSTVVMITVADGEIGNGLANAGDEVVVKNQAGEVVAAYSWSSDAGNGVSWEMVGENWGKCGFGSGNTFGYLRDEQDESSKEQETSESQDEGENNEHDNSVPVVIEEDSEEESGDDSEWVRFWEDGEDPVLINELMINPVGDDGTSEWIEFKSYWEEDIDLKGWWVCDSKCDVDSKEGGYEIGEVLLESGGYAVLERVDSKIALNNDIDSVWLFDPEHNLVASVVYDLKIKEGESFAWNEDDKKWEITGQVTKGLENEYDDQSDEEISNSKSQIPNESQDNENEQGSSSNDQGLSESQNEGEHEEVENIGEVKEKADGAKVSFKGVVTAEWNLLENQYLWMGDNTGGIGVKLDLDPAFQLGDKVWIAGEVHDLTYRKVVLVFDYKKIGYGEVAVSVLADGDELEEFEDRVVKLTGIVTETSGDDFYLSIGDSECRVYIKENTGIIKPEMKKGDSFEVTGIVNEIKSGFRVLPRYQGDVVKGGQVGILPKVGPNIGLITNFKLLITRVFR